jgi:hypothetical protein
LYHVDSLLMISRRNLDTNESLRLCFCDSSEQILFGEMSINQRRLCITRFTADPVELLFERQEGPHYGGIELDAAAAFDDPVSLIT